MRGPTKDRRSALSLTRRCRATCGAAAPELVALLAALALAGTLGMGALGGAIAGAIAGSARAAHPTTDAAHPSAQAGVAGALLHLTPPAVPKAGATAAAMEAALGAVPWDAIRAKDVPALVERVHGSVTAEVDRITSAARAPRATFDQTVRPLSDALDGAEYLSNVLSHLDSVLGSRSFTKANAAAQTELERLRAGVLARGDVVDLLTRAHRVLEAEGASTPARAVTEMLLEEAGHGVHGKKLSDAERVRARALEAELAELGRTFERNQTRAHGAFRVHVRDRAALKGLSSKALKEARREAQRAGMDGYLFRYESAGTDDALTSLRSADTRKVFWEALNVVAGSGPFDNRPVVERVLAARQELATLHGFGSYAEYVARDRGLTRRMLGTAREAGAFVDEMLARVRPLAERDLDELRAYRQRVEGTSEIQPWDRAYWSARLYEARFGDLDESEHLRLDRVLSGAFELSDRLFGVRFERAALPAWHDDVLSYRVTDREGRFLGHVQMDLLARRGKHTGSWQANIHLGEGLSPSHVVINSEITPTGVRALKTPLDIDETASVLHELGHALHVLLSRSQHRELGGTRVAMDFAEFPSQLLENWAWDEAGLARLSRSPRTGKGMPRKMARQLVESRRFGAALEYYDTLLEAKLDLALHGQYRAGSAADAERFAAGIVREHGLFAPREGQAFLTDFEHLFAGEYGASYHSYAWGELLEADAFERFREAGLFDEGTGRELGEVLAAGATVPADELFRRFRGRDPSPGALLARLGERADSLPPAPNPSESQRLAGRAPGR